ncbi:MAG: hypothetical protein ACR2MS_10820 [Weeksellaceae bacterium]
MKKLFILLLPFILVSCVDNELVIPGENVGNIDGIDTEEPIQKLDLKLYESDYPHAKFNIKVHDNNTIASVGSYILTRKDGEIQSVNKNGDTYELVYANGEINKIINSSKVDTMYVSKDNNEVTAVKHSYDGNQSNYTFEINNQGYYSGFTLTKMDSTTLNATYVMSGENITGISYSENRILKNKWSFSYDSHDNPLRNIGITDYNTIFLLTAFDAEFNNASQFIQLSLLFNKNNMTSNLLNDEPLVLEYNYESGSNDKKHPIDAVVVDSIQNKVGNIKYTYRK